jgi:hypothetical protein
MRFIIREMVKMRDLTFFRSLLPHPGSGFGNGRTFFVSRISLLVPEISRVTGVLAEEQGSLGYEVHFP